MLSADQGTAELPGDFCVWATTPAARFLHGRFVWANWDIEELETMRTKLEGDQGFLRFGLGGHETVELNFWFPKGDDEWDRVMSQHS